jgi:DMSO reductase anchor subunit
LGRPERAWRAVMMWKTSWLSREVIALPVLMLVTFICFISALSGGVATWLWILLALATLALWLCTAKIYQCLRFIQEWAHPSTLFNFVLLGISSGLILFECLLLIANQSLRSITYQQVSLLSIFFLAFAFGLKLWMWGRNRQLKPKSNLSSATGIKNEKIRQISMGFMGGSFNTREFFHHQTDNVIKNLRLIIIICCYLVPLLFMVGSLRISSPLFLMGIALVIHILGVLAERWMFFAEANHPQNLYYQRIA